MVLDALDGLFAGGDVDARVGVGEAAASPRRGLTRGVGPTDGQRRVRRGGPARPSSTSLESSDHGHRHRVACRRGTTVRNASPGDTGRGDEPVKVEVGERVDAEVVGDLADGQVGGEQLGAPPGVDPVEAWPGDRRARDAHVDLARPGFAQHRDDLPGRGAAHDRVIDDDQPLAVDDLAQRVELELDAALAQFLVGLDEAAADVAVACTSASEYGMPDANA